MVRCLARFIGSLGTLLFMVGECQNDSPSESVVLNGNYVNAHLFLSCDTNYVLIDVTVLAGAGAFSDICKKEEIEEVYGKSVELISAVNKCYWKQNCTIKLPPDIMMFCYNLITNNYNKTSVVFISNHKQCNCIWIKPEFLRPLNAKCIKAQDVQTICTGQQRRKVTCLSSSKNKRKCINLKKKKGMLRSHDVFPWNYNEYFKNKKFCLQFRVRNTKLVFGIKFIDLCRDSLTLQINGSKINLTNANENSHYVLTAKEKSAKLTFFGEKNTNGCGGFLICYKVVRNADKYDGIKRHVCDEFLTEPRILPIPKS